MSDIIPFQFNGHDVPAIRDDNGDPWWRAQEVCHHCGIKNVSKACERLDGDEKAVITLSDSAGRPQEMLIVNEAGLYTLALSSRKEQAKVFKRWVTHEVLPTIRKTGKYATPSSQPPSYQSEVEDLRTYVELAESLGLLDDRDKLMVKDIARTRLTQRLLPQGSAGPQALSAPPGFFLSDRVRTLGYQLTRGQEASLMSKGLAREVAKEYRDRHGEKAPQSQKFVDGAVRPVNWYQEADAHWIDVLIQTWCARAGIE